jgi:hypothetical protein
MQLLSRKDLAELAPEALMEKLQEDINKQKEEIDKVMDMKPLEAMEEELMKFMDENEKHVKGIKYELPNGCDFDGAHYTKSDVAKIIVQFLNRGDYKWEYTAGAYELVKFWKSNDPIEITYGVYDSTLRMLNQGTFKGFTDWKEILTVNEYMKGCHDAYTHDTGYTIYLAEVHNAIVERMQLVSKPAEQINENKA